MARSSFFGGPRSTEDTKTDLARPPGWTTAPSGNDSSTFYAQPGLISASKLRTIAGAGGRPPPDALHSERPTSVLRDAGC